MTTEPTMTYRSRIYAALGVEDAERTTVIWQLANLADAASPDALDSAGAQFLAGIADDVAETLDGMDRETRTDMGGEYHDEAAAIADSAVPIYTRDVWTTFVDLAAYTEDPSELGADGSDMEQAAKTCLYMIAERLAVAMFEAFDELDAEELEREAPHTWRYPSGPLSGGQPVRTCSACGVREAYWDDDENGEDACPNAALNLPGAEG